MLTWARHPLSSAATSDPGDRAELASVSVAVIILTMNQRMKTLRCLESLTRSGEPQHRVVLWDNGSRDGTLEEVRRRYPDVVTHFSETNVGVASGWNGAAAIALKLLAPTHLFFLDNDTTVHADTLKALVVPMLLDRTVGQTVPKIRLMHDPAVLDEAGGSRIQFWLGRVRAAGHGQVDDGRFDTPRDCVIGGCTVVRAEVFERLGGFDPAFNPYGFEDMDFSLRLSRAGWRARYIPDAVIEHERTQTFEGGEYTERFASHKARNWLVLMRRHASPLAWVGFMCVGVPIALARAILREGRRGNLRALRGWVRGIVGALCRERM